MKITIAGYGKVGSTIAERLLKENHDLTIVDIDPSAVEDARGELDIYGTVGNCASQEILREAGIKESDLLIAVTQSDEVNLLSCLIAKKIGAKKAIARVRSPIYSEEIALIKDDLGLSMVINPELAAAGEITRLLKYQSATKVETFAKGRVEILQYKLSDKCPLCDVRVMDIFEKLKLRVLICVVERGKEVFIPNGSFILKQGDVISFVAASGDADRFFKRLGVVTDKIKRILIIGGGRLTYYLAKNLLESGFSIKIIEKDRERCETLSEELPGAMIINGDGTDCRLLDEEGLSEFQAIATLTGNDEQNILVSMYAAKNAKGAKIITKVKHSDFDEMLKDVDVGSIVSPKHITSDYIIRYVRAIQNSVGSNVQALHKIVSDKVEALEFRVREASEITGIPLQALKLKNDILIGCINRGGRIIAPKGGDTIEVGDTVIVVTTRTGLCELSDILQ